MAHYAFLDGNNVVTEVIVGVDEDQLLEGQTPEQWYAQFRGQPCVRTSYNSRIRKNFAGIGYTYDPTRDAFIAPKPFPSWVLNETTCKWEAPIPMPDISKPYYWNEGVGNWVLWDE